MTKRAGIEQLEKTRERIAAQVRGLRQERRWTQRELAGKIGLSQARLSELERGGGSFAAEQLLAMLHLFNVPVTRFAPRSTAVDDHADLQNALARLGATHLQESDQVLPSERFEEMARVVREAILLGAPRLLTALAPVLVQHIDRVSLRRLDSELREIGLDRRLPWIAENVVEAIRRDRSSVLPRDLAARYRRAEVVLEGFLDVARRRLPHPDDRMPDVLDASIRSQRTLDAVKAHYSDISRSWGIVSGLQPEDFAAALEGTRAGV